MRRCDDAPDKDTCLASQAQFVSRDWKRAHHGDIEAAANVAFCLADATNCGIAPNPVQSCAWDLAILGSGSPDVDQTYADHARAHCADIGDVGLIAAKARAVSLVGTLPAFREPAD